jgi:uncharacterized YigZ family protein
MLFNQTYKMIDAPAHTLYKSKGSKFYAFAFPVRNEQAIKDHLNAIRTDYPDATHHCYAWTLGFDRQNFRTNDDGEPSNTAGKPIFRQIQKLELSNILIVVVRYFGGTMLGVPGLIEAYGQSAAECLALCHISEYPVLEVYTVNCPFGSENEVFRIARQYQALVNVLNVQECFSAEIKIPLHKADAFKRQVAQLYQAGIEYKGVE